MTMLFDTGALIALERNDRAMWRRLKSAQLIGHVPISHGGVVGQAWRGRGPRAARLAQVLAAIDVRPLDDRLGRASGELLAVAKRRDVVDAALVLLASDGDQILTSEPDDIAPLALASGHHVELVRV
jgi:predicted nucleic acid-binding protein